MTENSWKTLRIVAKKHVHMCVATESNIVFYSVEVIRGGSRGGSIGSIEPTFLKGCT